MVKTGRTFTIVGIVFFFVFGALSVLSLEALIAMALPFILFYSGLKKHKNGKHMWMS